MYFCHSFLKLKQLFAVKIFRFLFVYGNSFLKRNGKMFMK